MSDQALHVANEYRGQMRAMALRVTANPDDADDALQRALLIVWQKCPCREPHQVRAWAMTTVRREGIAILRSRARKSALPMFPGVDVVDRTLADPSEIAVERAGDEARADLLDALKPDERTALLMQGAGYSYAEIARRRGWTYTKVNRCIAEGRAALRESLDPQETDR